MGLDGGHQRAVSPDQPASSDRSGSSTAVTRSGVGCGSGGGRRGRRRRGGRRGRWGPAPAPAPARLRRERERAAGGRTATEGHEVVGGVHAAVGRERHADADVGPRGVDEVGVVGRAVDEGLHEPGDVVADAHVLAQLRPGTADLRTEVRVVGDLPGRRPSCPSSAGPSPRDRRTPASGFRPFDARRLLMLVDELRLDAGVGRHHLARVDGARRGRVSQRRRSGQDRDQQARCDEHGQSSGGRTSP